MKRLLTATLTLAALLALHGPPAMAKFYTADGNRGIGFACKGAAPNPCLAVIFEYDSAGRPTWRVADQSDQDNLHFLGDAYTFRDGQPLGQAWKAATPTRTGAIKITFRSAMDADLQLDNNALIEPITRTTIEAGRPDPTATLSHPETGWFWNPDEPGSGLHVETQGDKAFFGLFTYDSSGNPIWVYATGALGHTASGGWTFSGDLNLCTRATSGTVTCAAAGTISLTGKTDTTTATQMTMTTILDGQSRSTALRAFSY